MESIECAWRHIAVIFAKSTSWRIFGRYIFRVKQRSLETDRFSAFLNRQAFCARPSCLKRPTPVKLQPMMFQPLDTWIEAPLAPILITSGQCHNYHCPRNAHCVCYWAVPNAGVQAKLFACCVTGICPLCIYVTQDERKGTSTVLAFSVSLLIPCNNGSLDAGRSVRRIYGL